MARIPKKQLLRFVEQAIQDSGWNFLHLSAQNEHPARYQVYKNGEGYRVKIYIWNITHGGGAARAANEYRIQVTGIPKAKPSFLDGGKRLEFSRVLISQNTAEQSAHHLQCRLARKHYGLRI